MTREPEHLYLKRIAAEQRDADLDRFGGMPPRDFTLDALVPTPDLTPAAVATEEPDRITDEGRALAARQYADCEPAGWALR